MLTSTKIQSYQEQDNWFCWFKSGFDALKKKTISLYKQLLIYILERNDLQFPNFTGKAL